jgi:ribosome-binding protein aMBF1 (putative translation factor)
MSVINSKTCHCCNGTGRESTYTEDLALACAMRELRVNAGISGRALARNLGVKEAYVSMLESGKRRFTIKLLEGYRKHCVGGAPK